MDHKDITIAELMGQIRLLERERDWWAANQDYWRTRYCKEHPEITWDEAVSAFSDDTETPDPL